MSSIHAIRWIENLNDAGHELYWFDVLGKGELKSTVDVIQFTNWKKRKVPYLKGEYWLSKKLPNLYQAILPFLEVSENEALEEIINKIQPDIVQSFEMQSCSYPIVKTMLKFPTVKWLYNCWGNDLYYYQNFSSHKRKINQVLARVNYMTADCNRDAVLAFQNGFKGKFLDVIPGGGGYDSSYYENFSLPFEERKVIVVKGYHHLFGRGLNIIKALEQLALNLKEYEVVIFGAHKVVVDYVIIKNLDFKVYDRHGLKHEEVMQLMGKSLIYVGNNISDGMPNTLLEAMLMGAFPIQSNPGGATQEIIKNENGFLIQNPENIKEITLLITKAIQDKNHLKVAAKNNYKIAKAYMDLKTNQQKIIAIYHKIQNDTCA